MRVVTRSRTWGLRAPLQLAVAVGAGLWVVGMVIAPAPVAARGEARWRPFDYAAPPGCPGAAAFAAAVARRTAGAWELRDDPGEPRLSVTIVEDGDGTVGILRRTGRDAPAARELRATDCRDLVEGLALTTALSLEQEATLPSATAAPRAAPRLALGAALSLATLLPPGPMAAAALFIERGDPDPASRPILRSPDLALTVTHARNDVFGGAGQARFSLTTASLAACPLGWRALDACATAEIGMLDGQGLAIARPQSSRTLWLAGGLALRARQRIGRSLFLEAHAGLRAPLHRTEFVFEMPEMTVARVPALVADGGLALGALLP